MKRTGRLMAFGCMILAVVLVIWQKKQPRLSKKKEGSSSPPVAVNAPETKQQPSGPDPSLTATEAIILDALANLKATPDQSSSILEALEVRLNSQPDAAGAVARFLDRGEDAATNQRFSVGPGGSLNGTPSLRTALMDWLPGLDPQTALKVARDTLRSTQSPEEYAMALRNVAWNDLNGDLHAELSVAFQQMLDRTAWREEPSSGFLEAFDIAVQLGDPQTFALLANAVVPAKEHPDLIRAASMSMDRMILRDPSLLDTSWKNQPHWMDQAPMQRASLMSRLDLRIPIHRETLSEYLEPTRISEQEREYFTAIFPNGNHLYGHRLVTSDEKSPSIEERTAMDREFLVRINSMIKDSDPRNGHNLKAIRDRLTEILKPVE